MGSGPASVAARHDSRVDQNVVRGQFDDLSPFDFDFLVVDLLTHDPGRRFETFPRGGDGDVDLSDVPRAWPPRR
jgi:hypothetical protein